MDTDAESLFLEIAIEKGLLTEAQVKDLREAGVALQKVGVKYSFAQIAREKGFLDADQLKAVREEMRNRGHLPKLGGYALIAKLGQGGMGAVYKARQVSLDRIVALKVLPADLARNPEFVKRFEREARLACKINHPNAIQVIDVGEEAGHRFISMEFVAGSDVGKLLQKGPLPERRALEIVLGIARALAAAHAQGIVHRDIKPQNIMLTEQGAPKLADLGIARDIGASGGTLTRTGMSPGTPAYMSPEQAMADKTLDGRTDIYSLGITLFHMVCGRAPYAATSALALLKKHVDEALPDPRHFTPGLSDGVVALIRRMTEKDREKRFSNCDELAAAIEAALRETPEAVGPSASAIALAAAKTVTPARPTDAARPSPPKAAGQHKATPQPAQVVPRVVLEAAAAAEDEAPSAVASPQAADARRKGLKTAAVVAGVVLLLIVVVALARASERSRRPSQPEMAKAPTPPTAGEPSPRPPPSVPPKAQAPPGTDAGESKPHEWPLIFTEAVRRQKEAERSVALPEGWTRTKESRLVMAATPDSVGKLDVTYYKNALGMEFVLIPPGEFMMGSAADEEGRIANEGPQHRARITKPFYMGRYEVTQGQWQAVMGRSNVASQGNDKLPVVMVSWNECQDFCRKAGDGMRLPTEAEWEYACRAGTATRYCSGDSDERLTAVGWCARNTMGNMREVGIKRPNAWGLHDMHGGVWEWCADYWDGNYYDSSPLEDPPGPASGQARVLRGGSLTGDAKHCRSAVRNSEAPTFRRSDFGFRVVVPCGPQPQGVSAAPGPTSPTDARPPAPAAGTPAAQFFAALKAKNPDYNSTGDFTWQDGKLIGADLRACGLRDLSPLAGQPLVTLVCVENDVEDLTPLRGMPLTHLAISSTKVRDLSPLKGMPLKSLVITMLDLDDVSVLKDLPLERLFFSPDRIKGDFSFLRNHKTLKHMGTAHLYYTVESFWRWWDSGGRPFRPPSPPPGGGYPRSPTYETAKASLQKTAKFQIREKTIGYVVDAIAKSAGMRVEVSPACQDAVGAAVTLEAPSLTLEEALNRVLEPHGLGFDIPRDGVILIVRTPMPMP